MLEDFGMMLFKSETTIPTISTKPMDSGYTRPTRLTRHSRPTRLTSPTRVSSRYHDTSLRTSLEYPDNIWRTSENIWKTSENIWKTSRDHLERSIELTHQIHQGILKI